MKPTVEHIGPVRVITVIEPSLDSGNSSELKRLIAEQIGLPVDGPGSAGGGPLLVLDLSAVTFLDSSGCGALITAMRLCRQARGELRVCGLGATVRSLLEIIHLDRVLDIVGTRDEAVADLSA